jgi:hypothetical protein
MVAADALHESATRRDRSCRPRGRIVAQCLSAKEIMRRPRPTRTRKPRLEMAQHAQIMAALGRSGNNLNQLLRRVNAYDFRGIPQLVEMVRAMTAAHEAHHTLVAAIKPIFDSALRQVIETARQSARQRRCGTTCSGLAISRRRSTAHLVAARRRRHAKPGWQPAWARIAA